MVYRVCGAKLSWRFAGQMVHASSAHTKLDVYRQRKPQESAYYRCVEDCFETFEQVYQERFEQKYGFFRPYVRQVIYRYLDCGILKNGFARVRCEDCGHEYLDVRRFSTRISSPFAYTGFRRLFPRKRYVFGFTHC